MKNLKIQIFLFCALLMLISCDGVVHEVGNGNMITEEVEVENFEEIIVSGSFKIKLKHGDKSGLRITADENLMKFISPNVSGDRLIIETTKNIRSDEGLLLEITYNKLTAVEVSGAAAIENEGVLKGEYFNINMSGAGAIDLNLELRVLKVSVAGAGSVEVRGAVNEQNIQMSGAGGYDAYNLVSEICKIDISGVGAAKVNVRQRLNAEVSGVGGITYKGNPKDIKSDVSGLGSISQKEGRDDQ